jgi:Isochorismatase family
MAPLLKPSESSLLILDSAGEPRHEDRDVDVVTSRDRILQAAALCGIPAFLAVRDLEIADCDQSAKPARHHQVYTPPMPGDPWGESPLGLALARASRLSLLICGYWLDECITFTALNALAEGYDTYLVTDASPTLDVADRHTAILRLVQAGVVPTTTRQAIREWAGETSDAAQRHRLLALL